MTEMDYRVKTRLEKAGLKYTQGSDGFFRLLMEENDNRSQQVIVSSETYTFSGRELRDVESPAHVGDIPEAKVMAYCLEQNARLVRGSWRLKLDKVHERAALVFGVSLNAAADADELRKVIEFASEIADNLEAKLSSEDAF